MRPRYTQPSMRDRYENYGDNRLLWSDTGFYGAVQIIYYRGHQRNTEGKSWRRGGECLHDGHFPEQNWDIQIALGKEKEAE